MKPLTQKAKGLYAAYGKHDKVRFIIVGAVGFVANFLGLALFFGLLNLPILVAQVISVELAILVTFAGNNYWAFDGHGHIPLVRKLWRFHASALTGMAINSAVVVGLVRFLGVYYGLALAAGSTVALVWNYVLYKRFVFRARPKSE